MENKTPNTSSKKNISPILITGIVILGLLSAFLGWQLYSSTNLNNQYKSKITVLESDISQLDEMMKKNGLGNLMEQDIKLSLNNLLEDYSSVTSNNKQLNDSISAQREKVIFLLDELENTEKRRKYTAHELFKMKKEAGVLRRVMKDYVHRVDSLNTLNQELQATIKIKDNTITEVSGQRDKFKTESESLGKQVELGSKLQILNLNVGAIKIKRSGSFDETTRSRRADQVRACFTIVGNKIAKAGAKTFYLKITSPENQVLKSPGSKTITVGEKQIETSISRTIDYQNKNVDLCVFYEKQIERLPSGNYSVEVYSENILVGKSTFALK